MEVEFRLIDDENGIIAGYQGLADQVKDRTLAVAQFRCGVRSFSTENLGIDVVTINNEHPVRE